MGGDVTERPDDVGIVEYVVADPDDVNSAGAKRRLDCDDAVNSPLQGTRSKTG